MVDVERHAFGAAIDALAADLLIKVFAVVILNESGFLLLVLRELRVLELLRIELHQLRRDAAYRQVPAHPPHERKGRFHAVPQRRREPPLGLDAVQKAWRPTAEILRPAAATKCASRLERVADGAAPMLDDEERERMMPLLPVIPHDGGARLP